MYGPTETTIWSGAKRILKAKDFSNIGQPINNTQFYILDQDLNILPVGIIGRIFIGGHGLAKGYYKNDALTQEKFIENPFCAGQKIYETGDLGKWNEDGEIVFVGRNDNQVKVRGYRIELAEIENGINSYLQIDNSIVLVKKQEGQESILISFVPKLKSGYDADGISNYLRKSLPEYMIPARFIEVEKYPLTPNKKIDRKALYLLTMDDFNPGNKVLKKAKTRTEEKILDIWQEVLKLNREIGTDENFFSLGGHSLLAVKAATKISESFLCEILIRDIFENNTVESLSNFVNRKNNKIIPEIIPHPVKDYYNLTPDQLAIWIASQNKETSSAYNMFASFEVEGFIDIEKLQNTFRFLVGKYEILRTNFIEFEGLPYQKINGEKTVNFEIEKLTIKSETNLDDIIFDFLKHEFNLEKDILIKTAVFTVDNKKILFFLTHHILFDGISLKNFIKEVRTFYLEEDRTDNSTVFQFADYSEWLFINAKNTKIEDEVYWNNTFQNFSKKELIFNFQLNNSLSNFISQKLKVKLKTTVFVDLRKFVAENNTTLFNIFFTALNVFLYKFSKQNEICVGTVLSGRDHKNLENEIGMFTKSLPILTKINDENSFSEVLDVVKNNLLEVYSHQNLPVGFNLNKLFDILFVYQNSEFSMDEKLNFGAGTLKPIPYTKIKSRVPLVFNFNECPQELICEIDFRTDLYPEDLIKNIWENYVFLIEQILYNPNKTLREYSFLKVKNETIKNTIEFNF
jgi:acyl carrier protein